MTDAAGSPKSLPDAAKLADHWWWRPGWTVGTRHYAWHVTVADLEPLADHLERYQEPLRMFPFLDLVPRQWLHLTLQGIGHVANISEDRLRLLVDAVGSQLRGVSAPRLVFDRPVIFGEAVVIPPTDVLPLRNIREAIRLAAERVHGPPGGRLNADFTPHVSAAYVNAAADPQPVRRALDAVTPQPTEIVIPTVTLIEMHRDNRMYEWAVVARAQLGESA